MNRNAALGMVISLGLLGGCQSTGGPARSVRMLAEPGGLKEIRILAKGIE